MSITAMRATRSRRMVGYTVLLCVALAASGCNRQSNEAMLVDAFMLCEALEYEAALPLIRESLMRNPRNAVGHYLLGKYYQHREEPALTLAKGQFDTARNLYDTYGDLSILADVMTPAEFQATLHCDTALVLLRTVVEATEQGMPRDATMPVLRTARDHGRKARYFNPDSSFISDLAETLEEMVSDAETLAPREEEPPPPPLPPPGRFQI